MGEKRVVLTEEWGGVTPGQVATMDEKEAEPLLKSKKAFLHGTKEATAYLDKMFRAEQGVVNK